MPTKSILFNEYGATITPVIEELNEMLYPILDEFERWAITQDFDGSDWACLRPCLTSMRIYDYLSLIGDEHLQHEREHLYAVRKRLNQAYAAWIKRHNELELWETEFAADYARGVLGCTLAQIQIQKAMKMRKERRENKS